MDLNPLDCLPGGGGGGGGQPGAGGVVWKRGAAGC